MTTGGEKRCEVCRDIDVVRYAVTDEHRPEPFCGRCGRRIPAALVVNPMCRRAGGCDEAAR